MLLIRSFTTIKIVSFLAACILKANFEPNYDVSTKTDTLIADVYN